MKATPIPPEAEPQAPAQIATVIITNTSGGIDIPFNAVTRSANPCVFLTTPPKPTTMAVFRMATPESAAPLLKTFTHCSIPPLTNLNIRIAANATPENTDGTTSR